MDRAESEFYQNLSVGEKNEYLEGKLEIIQKNIDRKREEHNLTYRALSKEKQELSRRIEQIKEENSALKREIREKNSQLVGVKKQKTEIFTQKENVHETWGGENSTHNEGVTCGGENSQCSGENSTHNENCATIARGERCPASKNNGINIEWILSHLEGTIDFRLEGLTAEKLKTFGRFFKEEFDSLYNKENVLKGIEYKIGKTKELVKIVLYLSDRPEIVAQLLPYLFKGHIVADSVFYVKDVVKILERAGITSFLCDTDTLAEMQRFFEACSSSRDLVLFVLDAVERSPNSAGRLVSEEYLAQISRMHPEEALKIVESLERSGIRVNTSRARETLHQHTLHRERSVYSEGDLSFFF